MFIMKRNISILNKTSGTYHEVDEKTAVELINCYAALGMRE
ncbi:hypothetical protein HNP81_000248 [Peribacillus huizhouensis]|uniref:Uncharacterized protein n=1 Tax=Peribacillus huizhouensis TaxID=1501239 RepID=A0ABR6CJT3_9BACI|nr:hypothetical protein [Peribacillus huizhouensis]